MFNPSSFLKILKSLKNRYRENGKNPLKTNKIVENIQQNSKILKI